MTDESPLHTSNPSDFFNPDDVCPRDSSPPLTGVRVNYRPSPAPRPRLNFPRSPPLMTAEEREQRKNRKSPDSGDANVVDLMGGWKRKDIVRMAKIERLQSDEEFEDESSPRGTEIDMMAENAEDNVATVDLTTLAANALKAHEDKASQEPSLSNPGDMMTAETPHAKGEIKEHFLNPPMTYTEDALTHSPQNELRSSPTTQHSSLIVPSMVTHQHSPIVTMSTSTPASTSAITLPSITTHLGHFGPLDPALGGEQAPYSQPPQSLATEPHYPVAPGQLSDSKSPTSTCTHPPSPSQPPPSQIYYDHHAPRVMHPSNGYAYPGTSDYHGPMIETSHSEQPSLATTAPVDRMSIDGITNPQVGGYKCNFPGCTAQPFQTQYLLNSHANVHSSNRPHYCPIQNCSRAEGGKGFKRKNEMIRHGLVHESPGYICPFCPDRQHRYPRPDNLQRHVRVHHINQAKNDPRLRDVLAQRPEGPSRSRRRRGGV